MRLHVIYPHTLLVCMVGCAPASVPVRTSPAPAPPPDLPIHDTVTGPAWWKPGEVVETVRLAHGVADASSAVLFMQITDQSLSAIDAGDGVVRWTCPGKALWAGRIQATGPTRLFVARTSGRRMRIVKIDPDTGAPRVASDPIPARTVSSAHVVGNALVVQWVDWNDPPPRRENKPRVPIIMGLAWIALEGRQVHVQRLRDDLVANAWLDAALPPIPKGRSPARWQGVRAHAVWRAGTAVLALELGGQSLVLYRWQEGTERRMVLDPDVPRQGYLHLWATDPLHVVVARTTDREQDGQPAGSTRWRIYDVEQGSLVAEVPVAQSEEPPLVLGGRLLTVHQESVPHRLHLVGRDLRSGEKLWERGITWIVIDSSSAQPVAP